MQSQSYVMRKARGVLGEAFKPVSCLLCCQLFPFRTPWAGNSAHFLHFLKILFIVKTALKIIHPPSFYPIVISILRLRPWVITLTIFFSALGGSASRGGGAGAVAILLAGTPTLVCCS